MLKSMKKSQEKSLGIVSINQDAFKCYLTQKKYFYSDLPSR